MLTPVLRQKCQQWACEQLNWTTGQWKTVASSYESLLLHHVNGWEHVHLLPGEQKAPGCTVGKGQAGLAV